MGTIKIIWELYRECIGIISIINKICKWHLENDENMPRSVNKFRKWHFEIDKTHAQCSSLGYEFSSSWFLIGLRLLVIRLRAFVVTLRCFVITLSELIENIIPNDTSLYDIPHNSIEFQSFFISFLHRSYKIRHNFI